MEHERGPTSLATHYMWVALDCPPNARTPYLTLLRISWSPTGSTILVHWWFDNAIQGLGPATWETSPQPITAHLVSQVNENRKISSELVPNKTYLTWSVFEWVGELSPHQVGGCELSGVDELDKVLQIWLNCFTHSLNKLRHIPTTQRQQQQPCYGWPIAAQLSLYTVYDASIEETRDCNQMCSVYLEGGIRKWSVHKHACS